MGYMGERYIYYTGCYCERHSKVSGGRVDDHSVRMVVIKAGDYEAYMCTYCIDEIRTILYSKLVGVSAPFNLPLAEITKRLDPASRTIGVSAERLRETMTRYEEQGREMLKKIRSFEGKYTDRNVVCKEVRELLKNITSAVETYLQKT